MTTSDELCQNLDQLLDEALESGVPLEIEHRDRKLFISLPPRLDRFTNMKRRDCIVGDPEDFVHMDWSAEWKP